MPSNNLTHVIMVYPPKGGIEFLESVAMGKRGETIFTIYVERAWLMSEESARAHARKWDKENRPEGYVVIAMPYDTAYQQTSYCLEHWAAPGVRKINCGHCL